MGRDFRSGSARWAATRHASTDRLLDLVATAEDRRTTRLGHLLGPEGVRYVVVPVRTVPTSYPGESVRPPAWVIDVLAGQLDLERVDTDPALIVFRNTAWRGMATSVPAGTELPDTPEGANRNDATDWDPILDDTDVARYGITAPGETGVVAAVPDDGWTLEVDGDQPETDAAYGWALHAPEVGEGDGNLSYATSPLHIIGVLVQPLLWIAVLLVRSRLGRRSKT